MENAIKSFDHASAVLIDSLLSVCSPSSLLRRLSETCERTARGMLFRAVLPFILALTSNTASGEEKSILLGSWRGLDHASESIFAIIDIDKTTIAWGGGNPYNPPCHANYATISSLTDQETFPDNSTYTAAKGPFTVIKIKLEQNACVAENTYFQFAIPAQADFAIVNTYDARLHLSGIMFFTRQEKDQRPKGKSPGTSDH